MAGDAGAGRTGIAAAQRNQFAGGGKAICRRAVDRAATSQGNRCQRSDKEAVEQIHHALEPPPLAVVPQV
ncbi:hypothetical protein [Sphingobium sp. BS19]|uniref:hypothetical protein n=1 Tax=Sphingobium sp. BS19 TaxID=3018973 RepID=UPI0022EDC344|nr:hypothetical protein [Sphingobium sp. BS19]GLI98985.1 hypothetical protein Sbs19_28030 [Sphingobium sp. BS19]